MFRRAFFVALPTLGLAVIAPFACSSSSGSPGPGSDAMAGDAGNDVTSADSPANDSTTNDSGGGDAGSDATGDGASDAAVTGFAIVTLYGGALQAAAGDALQLQVVYTLADGTTRALPKGTVVTWSAPGTIAAQDPDDAGAATVLPGTGAQPTGFFVVNAYRPDRTDYGGTLFVLDPGTGDGGTLMVSATVEEGGVPDASGASATIAVGPMPSGEPDAGAYLYFQRCNCAECHGMMAEGTPPSVSADGGIIYYIEGFPYPYPAPGLNSATPNGSPNLAADPSWNATLLSIATLGDFDNHGVALRKPMPDWAGKPGLDAGPLGAQDFAHIYAWLRTQM